jgi:hypothetical protein
MNQNHPEFGRTLVTAFSTIGTEMAQANVWSGGSYTIPSALWTDVSMRTNTGTFNVTIQRRRRGGNGPTSLMEHRIVTIPLDAHPIPERRRSYHVDSIMIATPPSKCQVGGGGGTNRTTTTTTTTITDANKIIPTTPVDDLVRQLCRLCWIVREPALTGKLMQLAIQLGGVGIGKLPDNLYVYFIYILFGCWISGRHIFERNSRTILIASPILYPRSICGTTWTPFFFFHGHQIFESSST